MLGKIEGLKSLRASREQLTRVSCTCVSIFITLLLIQGIIGCSASVTVNDPSASGVLAQTNRNNINSGNTNIKVNAVVTAGGGVARAPGLVVFASVGEPGGRTVTEANGVKSCAANKVTGSCQISDAIQSSATLSVSTGAGSIFIKN